MAPRLQTQIRARQLRRALTPPEVRLWVRLRASGVSPRFRRQHPAGPYILDFFCSAANLAVEIDGSIHGHSLQGEHDARRDAWLASQGIEVMRIAAADVLRDPDEVADGIVRYAQGLARRR